MGYGMDGPELEEPGQPLDGVKSAECSIQRLAVPAVPFDLEHQTFDTRQVLSGLENEFTEQFEVLRQTGRAANLVLLSHKSAHEVRYAVRSTVGGGAVRRQIKPDVHPVRIA